MSNVKWTEEQLQAINEKGNNILVAAAAGSGKTAVLVERIINKVINENIDIDKILVVTFTSAAASEIRERILDAIYKKLEENPENTNLQRQINLINKANISTIHSFCLDIIRNNFYELNISNNFRVADATEIELMKYEVLEDLFEEKYLNNDENFENLINTYTGYRGDEGLQNLILNIYRFIQSSPFPKKWLEENVNLFNHDNGDFSQTVWGKIILQDIEEELAEAIMQLKNISAKMEMYDELVKFTKAIKEDIYNLEYIKSGINNWDEVLIKISNLQWQKWPVDKKITLELKEQAKEIRDKAKDIINKSIKKRISYDSMQANEDINYMYTILMQLKELILEFMKRFSDKKREKNIIDFNDIEHFALKILLDEEKRETEVAKRYKEKFEEIAIDEYQDSNLVQEQILTSISKGNNVFMVGDVKQSIYKFRQARPQLFIEKYNKYKLEPEAGEDRKIQLFKNFRSRENVLNITNMVFEDIMSKELGDIDYNTNEYLNLGASYLEIPEQDYTTDIEIIDTSDEDNDIWKDENSEQSVYIPLEEDSNDAEQERVEDVVLEARFVAKKIKELIDSKYQVIDKKEGKRNIRYKDIAILLRSITGIANVYEKEISMLGIPVYSDSSGEYLQSIEIETIMSLLRIINNPMQDIPLVTVMRSPIGNFTDNELIEIRLNDRNSNFYEALMKTDTPKVRKFLQLLEELRNDEQYMALDEWIWNIYAKTGYMNYVSLMPNGNLRVSNLKMLFERAKQYESASFKGLFNFINFIDKIKFNSEDLTSAKIIGENDDVVRIMSIHKSKGLEFPVVILAGVGKQFNMQDLNEKILLDQDLGLGPQYIDSERHIEFKTLAKKALAIKAKREAVSEEMRVLYVALTRPKEKLIIVGRQKDANKKITEKQKALEVYPSDDSKINAYLLQKYKTYLDWLELIYEKEGVAKTEKIFRVNVHNKKELLENLKKEEKIEEDIYQKIIENAKKSDKEEKQKILEYLNWKYPHEEIEGVPTKTSVTKIKEMVNAEQVEEQTKNVKFAVEETKEAKAITQKPKFVNNNENAKISNAQKGTLMHLCVQKMNEKEEYTAEKIQELIDELKQREIISKAEAESINIGKLQGYTKSDLWQELKNAKEIHKEKAFYINVKASRMYDISKENDENILVQGIIDLYYIDKNGKLVLVDYKTDYVEAGKENELVEKYKEQLYLYKDALEKALNRKVDRMWIYSLYLNESIVIEK